MGNLRCFDLSKNEWRRQSERGIDPRTTRGVQYLRMAYDYIIDREGYMDRHMGAGHITWSFWSS
jgi:hypothetical protein